jgi:hypothetical protein
VRSIAADYETVGEAVWGRFTGAREGTLWYYRALVTAFQGRVAGPLLEELGSSVADLELAAANHSATNAGS